MLLKQPQEKVYDLIGVGIGPFNLGLAAMIEETGGLEALFFEKENQFNWHEGMLIDGTTLQVPFLADLVSMANVRSKYTFLNYLQEHNRLYHFYFLEDFHIPRVEFNHYCRWVAKQLKQCKFGSTVERIDPVNTENGQQYKVTVKEAETGAVQFFYSKQLVLGIGTNPAVPSHLVEKLSESVIHTSQYLEKKEHLKQTRSVTIIGSGQSAAEVFLDLAQDQADISLNWFTRSDGFFPMEYSKLGLEYFSPDYIEFFYHLPQKKKDEWLKRQDLLYKGISADTIADIYRLLYQKTVALASPGIHLQAMTELIDVQQTAETHVLTLRQHVTEEVFEIESDAVILGTGYSPTVPHFLLNMQDKIVWDEQSRYQISRDYKLQTNGLEGNIFIQNGELHTHGVGAPDLGLGAYRNATIVNQLCQREVYPVSEKNVFQTFGTERSWKPEAVR